MPRKKSKLDRFATVISDLHEKGTSYATIAQTLSDDYGIKASTTTVYDYVTRRAPPPPDGGKESPSLTDAFQQPANQDQPEAGELAVQLRGDIGRFHETTVSFHQALTEALEQHLTETNKQVATAMKSFEQTTQDISTTLSEKIDALAMRIDSAPPAQETSDEELRQQIRRAWKRSFGLAVTVCSIIFVAIIVFISV